MPASSDLRLGRPLIEAGCSRSPAMAWLFRIPRQQQLKMHFNSITPLLLAATAAALPVESPLDIFKRDPAAGVIISQCTRPGVLALAYDDGPYQYTSELVDILDEAGAKATFFWTGTLYGCIYGQRDAVQKAYASGHQVASHTWTHPNTFGQMSEAQILDEMDRLDQALVNLIGQKPLYMRPPYLQTGGNVLPTMGQLGFKVITTNVDSGDWDNRTPEESLQRFEQAGSCGNGHVSLMHETYASTVRTLTPYLINWANSRNLELVTVGKDGSTLRENSSMLTDVSGVSRRSRRRIQTRQLYGDGGAYLLSVLDATYGLEGVRRACCLRPPRLACSSSNPRSHHPGPRRRRRQFLHLS